MKAKTVIKYCAIRHFVFYAVMQIQLSMLFSEIRENDF